MATCTLSTIQMCAGNANPEYTYLDEGGHSDAGTDSDTISSCGVREHDFQDIAHLSEVEKEQELFWAASHAKSRWRQFMRKPVRKVHRFFRKPPTTPSPKARVKESRKENACPERVSLLALLTSMITYEDLFFGRGKGRGKGKSKNVRSSDKGKGCRPIPRGKDGNIMKCLGYRSEYHLVRDCANNTRGKGGGRPGPSSETTVKYVDHMEYMFMLTTRSQELRQACDGFWYTEPQFEVHYWGQGQWIRSWDQVDYSDSVTKCGMRLKAATTVITGALYATRNTQTPCMVIQTYSLLAKDVAKTTATTVQDPTKQSTGAGTANTDMHYT